MPICMRTTLRLDDDLLDQAKRYAAENGMTLTALIDQTLREALSRGEQVAGSKAPQLPTYRGRGLQPGVDLDDSAALLDLMEGSDDPS